MKTHKKHVRAVRRMVLFYPVELATLNPDDDRGPCKPLAAVLFTLEPLAVGSEPLTQLNPRRPSCDKT